MYCTECGVRNEDTDQVCANCGAALPWAVEIGRRDGPAWEKSTRVFDLGAMYETVRDVLFHPTDTFSKMAREGGLGDPVLFYVILGTVFGWVGLLWDWLLPSLSPGLAPGGLLVLAVLFPLVLLLSWAVSSAVTHLFLMLVGGAQHGFETTARVVAYASGSTAIFAVVPFCGSFIQMIWALVVWIIGLARAHDTTTGRTLVAVLLLPLFLFCVIFALFTVLTPNLPPIR